MTKLNMYIDGQWVAAKGNKTMPVVNPTTGQVMAEVPASSAEDVDQAASAARRAFDEGPWKTMTAQDRGKLLFRMAELVRRNAKELSETDTQNMGKPIIEAEFDVGDAANCFEYYGGLATKIHGQTLNVPDQAMSLVVREPVGAVGQIIPWNYPLLMAAWKIGPVLASGCTTVLKPAEQSPLTALRIAKLCEEAEIPKGVVNVITGDGMGAGAPLVAHPKIDKIAFTGGTDAGRHIIRNSAETIKRLTMELGGKNPNIVFADADFDAAIDGALFGAFANQGEVCSAGSRLLVEESIYARFVKELGERVKRVKVGDPMNRDTKMGPVVTKEHRERVMSYIEIGRKEAKLLAGGGAPTDPALKNGWFIEPTIFVDCGPDARIVREEIFGPVLAVMPFKNEAEAVRMANDTPYGLAGGVWTRDVFKGIRVMKELRAGILWLNTYHPTYNEAPWGGYKQSGYGRELGLYGIEGYLEVKQMNINLREEPLGWY